VVVEEEEEIEIEIKEEIRKPMGVVITVRDTYINIYIYPYFTVI
jgi:hypothetical protein